MIVNSVRLGQIEVPEDKIITMVKPILGFEQLDSFCLVEIDEIKPFLWLQSTQDSAVSFLVANPRIFKTDYVIEVNSKEIAELDIQAEETVETYVILTFYEDSNKMSANLQGPVLINSENNLAKQLVLVNSDYPVKYMIFDGLPETTETQRELEETAVEV